MKNIYLVLLLVTLKSVAQDSLTVNKYRWAVSFAPQYMLANGLKIDIDKKVASKKWLILGLQVYLGDVNKNKRANTSSDSENLKNYDQIKGMGLDLSYKYFLSNPINKLEYYAQAGGCYNYYNIDFQENTFIKFTNENGEFYKYGISNEHLIIHRFGGNFVMGIQILDPLEFGFKNSFLDFNVGIAARNAEWQSTLNNARSYKRTIWDYQSTAIYPTCTLRFGVMF